MNIILFDKLNSENKIKITTREAEHILNILKLKKGDEFRAGEWGISKGVCTLKSIDNEFLSFTYAPSEDGIKNLPLVLLMAQIRPICMKRVLRFVGECGIKGLILTPCQLSEKSYLESSLYNIDNIRNLIKEGAEISKDAAKVDVYFASSLENAIDISAGIGVKNKYLLDIAEEAPKLECRDDNLSCIAIGPERGWSDKEREVFMKNGFLVYNIGNKVFRSEESAIVSVFPWL